MEAFISFDNSNNGGDKKGFSNTPRPFNPNNSGPRPQGDRPYTPRPQGAPGSSPRPYTPRPQGAQGAGQGGFSRPPFNKDRNDRFGGNKNHKGPRMNGQIRVPEVRLIDHNGEMIGVMSSKEAYDRAQEVGLDLVEISPNAEPPVCKILDYGKFLYEEQKKKKEAKKHQKVIQTKEVKLRVTTDKHDMEYKIRNARGFIEEGDKVKFSLRFKGREIDHKDLGFKKYQEILEELKDIAKPEIFPRMEGGQLVMILVNLNAK
jgi:translation initiation factor IF-3